MSNINRRNFVKSAIASTAVAAPVIALAEEKKKVNLRMQSYAGEETEAIFKKYTDNVASASKDSIRIKRYNGGTIVPDDKLLNAVSNGTLDMCQGYGGYWADKVDVAILEGGVAGAWISSDEAGYVFRKGLLDIAREAYAEHNVHYLAPVFGGAYDLLTKTPVKSLEDLKKLTIRTTPSVAKILNQFDIPTVYLSASELHANLSSGAIDGVIYGGQLEYTDLKLFEVAKNYTRLNMLYPGYIDCVLINKDKWASLSKSHRAILEMATIKHSMDYHGWLVGGNYKEQYTKNFDFHTLPKEDASKLHGAAKILLLEEAEKSDRNKKIVELIGLVARKR